LPAFEPQPATAIMLAITEIEVRYRPFTMLWPLRR
jgi:hypothetical protein